MSLYILLIVGCLFIPTTYFIYRVYRKSTENKYQQRIKEAIEKDRERIGLEFYESSLQRLQRVGMRLDQALVFNLKHEVQNQLIVAKKDIEDEIKDLKQIIFNDLHIQLGEEKFSYLLERFCLSVDGLINWKIMFQHNNPENEFTLPPLIHFELLRICQRVIQNTFAHGLGSNLFVSLAWGKKITIIVEDDGLCFTGNKKGLGQYSVETRAQKIGATLKITSGVKGVKTVIELNPKGFPLKEFLQRKRDFEFQTST